MKHDVSNVSPEFLHQRIEEARGRAAAERDPFGPNGEVAAKPLRPMPSWIELGERKIDRSQYHIGEGFLEIGGFVMLIGQSYAGKSTLIAQISINAAIGRSWLFFCVHRPLRVLTVQAEDSENKLIRMGQMYHRMGLSDDEVELATSNTAVLTIRDLQDAGAIAEIQRHAEVFKPDIIVINPMTSYLSGGVYKDEFINRFLRVQLTPMLDQLKASAIVVHHPPKPTTTGDKEPKDLTAYELQYGAAGMAALANAPRGNMFLVHVDDDVFKLSVGKGFEDLGTKEAVAFLRRSKDEKDIMLWERCESEKAEEATAKEIQRKSKKDPKKAIRYESLLALFKPASKLSYEQVLDLSPRGRDWTVNALKELVRSKKLVRSPEHNPKGAPSIFFHLPTLLEPATGDWEQ